VLLKDHALFGAGVRSALLTRHGGEVWGVRVLVVEDSKRLRTYVGKALVRDGLAVDLAADGEEGLHLAEINDYDVIVLDLMLPKLDGISVLKRLRNHKRRSRVLLLTARDTVEDRVHGLQQGADDYLVKPFAIRELLARVQVLTRRQYDQLSPEISVDSIVINTASRTVRRAGTVVDLRPREYALLEYLAVRKGHVVSRREIEQHIYDDRVEPMSNVVDAAICRLRKKIDRPGEPSLITTRRGMGYVLSGGES
jgi:DNA-binding response OmpR family regulator